MSLFNTPILFLIFNRPDTTQVVFNKIREVKPAQLFVAADGPRAAKPGEAEICAATKKIITDGVDWDCKVTYLFREENLGCGPAVSGAITWFFEQVEEGIILEDDCDVDLSFFHFSSAMLEKYRHSDSVFHISANGLKDPVFLKTDYAFTKYPLIWGWATWRRAWAQYTYTLDYNTTEPIITEIFSSNIIRKNYWLNVLRELTAGKINTWDYQWVFCCLKNKGLSIIPQKNMISNIGFDERATHTTDTDSARAMQVAYKMDSWQKAPLFAKENKVLTKQMELEIFGIPYPETLLQKIKRKIRNAYSSYFHF